MARRTADGFDLNVNRRHRLPLGDQAGRREGTRVHVDPRSWRADGIALKKAPLYTDLRQGRLKQLQSKENGHNPLMGEKVLDKGNQVLRDARVPTSSLLPSSL